MYERSLAINEKAYGEGCSRGTTQLINIGIVNDGKGDHAAALRSYSRAAEIAEAAQGKRNMVGACSLALSAATHTTLGDTDEAASCIAESVAMLKAMTGNTAAALSVLQVVLSGKEAAHGREHAACAPVLLVMAQLHDADGDTEKASELRQRAEGCA